MKALTRVPLIAVLLVTSAALSARAQVEPGPSLDPAQARRARAVAGALMSPFCPGKTLDACPSPYAAEWRQDIRTWTAAGLSDAAIQARLQARVPDFQLEGRPGEAWDWALPVGSMALASAVLLWVTLRLRRGIRAQQQAAASAPGAMPQARDDALDAQLDRELAAFDDA